MRITPALHLLGGIVLLSALLLPSSSQALERPPAASGPSATGEDWLWPVEGHRIVLDPFRAPAQKWMPGHRGMDVAAAHGIPVRAPESGTIAFSGVVVDRPLLTIAHDGGLVTTLEPVEPMRAAGDAVARGEIVGTVAEGGHTPRGALHIGVRWHGAYINPMTMFGGIPRAVLLPCCGER